MNLELKKRIMTSFFLLSLMMLMFLYTYILIISVIILSIITWIEFYGLISKIFFNNNNKDKILRFLFKSLSLLYLFILVYLIVIVKIEESQLEIFIIYSIVVSIMTDIGGFVIGKTFKGKKLTRISPKKTIAGAIGSLIFSICLIPLFLEYFHNHNFIDLLIITLIISLISQFGDLFISFLKRGAKVKDTSDLLPGHGGILDRVDGMIFAIPFGFLLLNYL